MIVSPKGSVWILNNIQWNPDGKNVRMFDSEEAQTQFMLSHRKYLSENYTYIREQKALRVPIVADNLYDCNYISFLNNGFGNKRFYAFIKEVKYINTETSEILFDIDWFQTWWFEMRVGNCFVEREHVNDDSIGANLIEENLPYGDYFVQETRSKYWSDWKVQFKFKPSVAYFVQGHYEMTYDENQVTIETADYNADSDNVGTINTFLNAQLTNGNELIGVEMYPLEFDTSQQSPIEVQLHQYINRPTRFLRHNSVLADAYVPKNNKLFTYPYCYINISNNQDTEKQLSWEHITDKYGQEHGHLLLHLYYNKANKVSCSLEPVNYDNYANRLRSVPITNFPKMSVSAVDYASPLKGLAIGVASAVGTVVGGPTLGVATGGVLHAGANYGGGLSSKSNTTINGSDDNLNLKYNRFGYSFYSMAIDGDYAEVIDNYFTRYGYLINRLKRPNLTGRRFFNYVKTRDCVLSGTAPEEAKQFVCDMFNSGVTLWHNDNIVLDTDNIDNSIVTP